MSSNFICPDLLYLILKLLPVETLVRCRSVCKSWKRLIDSPSFILDHLSLQKPRILLQKHDLCVKTKEHSCVFQQKHCIHLRKDEFFNIVLDVDSGIRFYDYLRGPRWEGQHLGRAGGSVNGVVCVYDRFDKILLWNPSIRRQLSIPLPNSYHQSSRTKYICGFWMDPCNKEFKVVILSPNPNQSRATLYSSRKKEWVELVMDSNHDNLDFCQYPQVLVDRVAYWTATIGYDGVYVLVFFDFEQHKFGTIELPFVRHKDLGVYVNVFKQQGLLWVVYSDAKPDPPFGGYIVYVMQNGSWSTRASYRKIERISEVLNVQDFGWWVLAVTSEEGRLVLYDREDESYIFVQPRDRKYMSSWECLFSFPSDFVESLVFPDHIG